MPYIFYNKIESWEETESVTWKNVLLQSVIFSSQETTSVILIWLTKIVCDILKATKTGVIDSWGFSNKCDMENSPEYGVYTTMGLVDLRCDTDMTSMSSVIGL